MKEVLETVSEVQFKSIAVIVAVALLGMLATWWAITGSASPPLSTDQTREVSSPRAKTEMETQRRPSKPATRETEIYAANPAAPVSEPAISGAEYTIQVGAFQQEEGARRRLSELRESGHQGRIVAQTENGTNIFRVLVGKYSTRDEASLAVNHLRESEIEAFIREGNSD